MIHKVKHTRRNRGLLLSTALALSSVFCTAHAAEKPLGAYRVINVRVGSALNVRAEHNSQSEDIGSASPGSRLYVVDFAPGGNWAKVKWDDGHGWVSARFLSLEKPSDKEISQLVELQSRQAQPTYTAEQLAAASLEVEAANTPPSTAALQNT
ncbi:MAG: SH3 domain-containing protein, partial [Granulosicoccaceae bacterium]